MPYKDLAKRRAYAVRYAARYNRSARGKAAQVRYRSSTKGRAVHRAAQVRFRQTEKGRAAKVRNDVRFSQTVKGRAAHVRSSARTRVLYPEKVHARSILNHALRDGYKERPMHCSFLTPLVKEHRGQIQAHHFDYSKPLEVIWVCLRCHRKLDVSLPFEDV